MIRKTLLLPVLVVAAFLTAIGPARAATAAYQYSGTTSSTMSVNDGTHVGSIPAGTPYTGTLAFDDVPTAAPVAFAGGTHTVYGYSQMTFTAMGQTLTWGPGSIHVYDNLTSTTSGYPTGDSVYANINGVGPTGTINGAFFNWIFLGFVDGTGTAVTGGAVPAPLSLAAFRSSFVEFNYGTKGTPWGAGNTSTLQFLSGLTQTAGGGTTPPPPPVACSGTNGVVTAYAARTPGFIVVNGGLDLLDHLWTTNLNAGNTTFLGGLVNWYQTGDIVDWHGTVDASAGCILDSLTVRPAVQVATTALPSGTVGVAYSAPVAAQWGVAPYALTVGGLPAGLSFDGSSIVGTPSVAGTFAVTIDVTDGVGATASASLSLGIAPSPTPSGNFTIKDESKGKITAVAPDSSYLMVGSKKLVWGPSTTIIVNTPDGELHVIDSFVKVGMRVQWKGLRDKATNTVLTSSLEVN